MYYQLLALPCVVNSCLLLRVAPPLVPHASPTVTGSILAAYHFPGTYRLGCSGGEGRGRVNPQKRVRRTPLE